ncbi:MAG: DUF6765 family protein [Ruminococcus sp.]|nr:DUF6765 family protein [uncultured Ruminococcus sp.]MBQ1350875.1 hypothetical protein [Ruminococcus sp.]MBQ2470780.1 hypothetical protein [Ruminococcus sp.]SCX08142.1 hypothetical protein SAMN02910436_00613 [Ruminococcaceae bacterium P7]
MNPDFHYYATYCAAILAGFSHDESMALCYSDQLVDLCSATLLTKIKGPLSAATTQLQLELMDARTDMIGLQNITRIWASFHFLPYDLAAEPPKRCSKRYRSKYRLICQPNSELLERTVRLAKDKGMQAAGIAMHILADTWAHRNFAGTPSLVINNSNRYFYELFPDGDGYTEKKLTFRHSASAPDDLERSIYTSSLSVTSENSIMNLGHGRVGHLPDYCFIRYKYLPAWGGYEELVKDNPADYHNAFCQMIYAMKYLRGVNETFERGHYDTEAAAPYEQELQEILNRRQLDASADWKALGEKLSGHEIEPFDLERYQAEYMNAGEDEKDGTFLGRFIRAAMAQKSMVTTAIHQSGNKLAGYSVEYDKGRRRGIKDYRVLLRREKEERS